MTRYDLIQEEEDAYIEELKHRHGKKLPYEVELIARVAFSVGYDKGYRTSWTKATETKERDIQLALGLCRFDGK